MKKEGRTDPRSLCLNSSSYNTELWIQELSYKHNYIGMYDLIIICVISIKFDIPARLISNLDRIDQTLDHHQEIISTFHRTESDHIPDD